MIIMAYTGQFQATWDLSTPALRRIVQYGPKHLQYEAAIKELAARVEASKSPDGQPVWSWR